MALFECRDIPGIEAECRADVCVAELSTDEVDGHSGGQRKRREGVPHLVERAPLELGEFECRVPNSAPPVREADVPAFSRREDQLIGADRLRHLV